MKSIQLKCSILLIGTLAITSVSAQNVGIATTTPDSTLSIANKVNIGASQGDILLTDDMASITFPATTMPNSPMIYMFRNGTSNDNRMVFGHSPAYPNYGLQYRDTSEQFYFMGNGNHAFSVSVVSNRGQAALGDAIIDPAYTFNIATNTENRVINIHNNTNTSSVTHGVYARNQGDGSGPKRGGLFGATGGSGTNIGVMATASGSSVENIAVYGFAIGANAKAAHFDSGDVLIDDDLMIGTDQKATGYKLSVNGKIISEELRIQDIEDWPDYVFDANYQLPTLDDVELHIKQNQHLPGIPSAAEVESTGLDSGQMHKLTMQKIEELTLYVIELNKENSELHSVVDQLILELNTVKSQIANSK